MEERRAWLIFLSSNNYYLYMLLGLYKNLLDTKTKYPIYCGVTAEVNSNTRFILKTVGLELIDLDSKAINGQVLSEVKSKNCDNWFKAFTKLTLLDTQIEQMFDKIVYIDTDVQVFSNIDDVFDYPHMAAIEDVAPSRKSCKTPYTLGCSKFCSGLFVWDFKNNPGKGHEILMKLPELSKKVAWHDQNVLNYFYQDWRDRQDLHIPPEYGLMNCEVNFNQIKVPIKAIHYTNRLRTDWPFNSIKNIPERQQKPRFKEWVKNIANTIEYFNKKYDLKLPAIHAENIRLITREEEKAIVADGRPNTYLYF